MEVPWPYDRCILCLGTGPLSEEHIIPDSIGGKLLVSFLCASCDGGLGHEIEHSVKNDAAIRLAVESLKGRMPTVAKQVRESQAYFGSGRTGPVRGRLKDGQASTLARVVVPVDGRLFQVMELSFPDRVRAGS